MPSVMIAEDDLFMADMLEEVLVDGGYDVCGIARTVEQAIELGERHKPDLAVLDIRLAEGGLGTDVATRLKRRGSLGVLYASGHVGQMVLTKDDGDALLVKPYRPEDVVHALKIVEQIVSTNKTSRRFPKGFSGTERFRQEPCRCKRRGYGTGRAKCPASSSAIRPCGVWQLRTW